MMRCLLVEDECSLATTTAEALRARGWVIDTEPNGLAGLKRALKGRYDVVILDIMLPHLNGYDVLKGIRAQGVWTPVLMLSSKDGEYDQTDAFELGADDYVTKPFHINVLAARLTALLRRGETPRSTVLSAGDLVLDPGTGLVTRHGIDIRLTSREFTLLAHLLRHVGEVQSKAALLENVWDSNYPGDDNVVEVYIGYLRRKIDTPFGVRSIQTIRGRGYRLVAIDSGPDESVAQTLP